MDRLEEWGVVRVNFLGGEVMTVPWFPELAARGTARGIAVGVATNGTLIDAARADALRAAGVRQVQISFDGDRAAHDAIRGEGAFERALRGLRRVHARGIPTKLAFTLMASNKDCLPELIALAHEEGVTDFKLHGYIPCGRSSAELAEVPAREDVRAAVAWLEEEARRTGLGLDLPCYTGHLGARALDNWRVGVPARQLSCGAGNSRGVIWEDGTVGACDFIRDAVGDLRTQSFPEIWTGGHEEIEKWRRLDRVHGKCGSCGYQADCGFGCRANAFYAAGDFYDGDPSCISEPPPGEVHPHDRARRSGAPRTRRVALPVLR
jgi:radical SAM protein with 4Fe4S-binding SPASM domain